MKRISKKQAYLVIIKEEVCFQMIKKMSTKQKKTKKNRKKVPLNVLIVNKLFH